ncbi:MAG: phosphoadenylyl-sulfate reductase [Gemmatimonadaceae bacterium]|nr:phosphoadenylyl-sulfate reductase [Acetobacteraceae bacterium]
MWVTGLSTIGDKLLVSQDVLRQGFADYAGRIALVSSFGAESAVLLALVADLDRSVPVLFLETKRHFPETLRYRQDLTAWLGLLDVRDVSPAARAVQARDPDGALHAFDADACCALRKGEPMDDALAPFGAWVTGRKRSQSATRAAMPLIEHVDGRAKLNPLADWTAADIEAEMVRRRLPRHPLAAQGYRSIGCAPCTQPTAPGADPRSGRWSATAKTECGIHRPMEHTT